jgi:Fe-S cluster assembly protein SufD
MTVLESTSKNRDAYLAQLLKVVTPNITGGSNLQELRSQAIGFLQELTIPTTKDEEWRFTDLSPLLNYTFALPTTGTDSVKIDRSENQINLVFVNGIHAPELSSLELPVGVFVGNLTGAQTAGLAVGNYLGKQPGGEEVFTAINTAGINDTAIVWLSPNVILETPIHLLFITTTAETTVVIRPRVLVVMETGSSATIIEEYLPTSKIEYPYLNNSVAEIYLAANARLNHSRIQQDDISAFHIGKTVVSQARDSHYTGNAIAFGAQLSRHHWEIFQTGAQTETNLNGLAMIGGQQLADTHSTIALAHPHGTTNQIHKCIIDDRAHSVFNGKVFVPQAAQLTNAAQLNRNLLLSNTARVDTKPQLEITADNVKCSHGATVSQLEDDEIFYLQSRGLDALMAKSLLINAFAVEIIDRIPIAALRDRLIAKVKEYRNGQVGQPN